MNREVRPLFLLNQTLVTSAEVDVGVGGIRARLGRNPDGAAVLVEDLAPECLSVDEQLRTFRTELALRGLVGTRALHVRGAPVGVREHAPGVPFERMFRALRANGGLAPSSLVIDVARAAVPALQCFVDAPVAPDDVAMLVWARFDGTFEPSPRVRRVHPRTSYTAPEHRRGPYNERMLVFSLGVLMHYLFFGVEPHVNDPAAAASGRRRRRERRVADPVDALGQLVFACTHEDPALRPPSLDEVARKLQELSVQRADDGDIAPTRSLFGDDWREEESVLEQLAMLDVGGATHTVLPVLAARPLGLREERIWLNGGQRPSLPKAPDALP